MSNPEALTLFTIPTLSQIYHREEILRERDLGGLPRTRADRYFAKVLPPMSPMSVEPAADGIVRIIDCSYRPFYRRELFAIAELLRPVASADLPPTPALPPVDSVLSSLHEQLGVRYLFGGSAASGSPSQAEALIRRGLFLPEDERDADLQRLLHSQGLDCSGLFNLCSNYHFFGDSKDVYDVFRKGLLSFDASHPPSAGPLSRMLRPLDLIVQRGHVMIVIENQRVIQSVGDGTNATTFSRTTGWSGDPHDKYDRVVIDDLEPILEALLDHQARRLSSRWSLDDAHLMVVRSVLGG